MNQRRAYVNGKFHTQDDDNPMAQAVIVIDDRFSFVGSNAEALRRIGDGEVIDLAGRCVIPGLNDTHTHGIRQGLNFALELRWDGVRTLEAALAMLRDYAAIAPPGQWIRVVGGWSLSQFEEKRLPTIEEINAVSPDVPVYVLHVYDRAWLNRAALDALGIDEHYYETWHAGHLVRDDRGVPTGLVLARPNAFPLYALLDMAPKLDREGQRRSTRQYMQALNALGVTSLLDCAGGFLNYPDDYNVITDLHATQQLTVRMGYQLFAQRPGKELEDFKRWNDINGSGRGDSYLKCIGAGEMLVASAYDYEDFSFPRPTLAPQMEGELRPVLDFLLSNGWSFRFHCTYDESARRLLDVIESVAGSEELGKLNWILDHGETLSEQTIERVARLGGGISYQNRLPFQVREFREQYGEAALREAMPVRKMIASGVPLASGTDATRVTSYNPWFCIHWLVTGLGMGGERIWNERDCLTRDEAIRHWTRNGAWFSRDIGEKGMIKAGQLADFAVLTRDFFEIDSDEIPELGSVLTVVGGRIVHGDEEFSGSSEIEVPRIERESPVYHFGAPGMPAVA